MMFINSIIPGFGINYKKFRSYGRGGRVPDFPVLDIIFKRKKGFTKPEIFHVLIAK